MARFLRGEGAETEAWPWVVALGLAVAVGAGLALRRKWGRHKVYVDAPFAPPLPRDLTSKQLRSWIRSSAASGSQKPAKAWTADLEKIVEEYATLEGRCELVAQENDQLKREVDNLATALRKGGCQTPLSSVTLSTTLNSFHSATTSPCTDQSMTPKSDDDKRSSDAPVTRPPSSERAGSSESQLPDEIPEQPQQLPPPQRDLRALRELRDSPRSDSSGSTPPSSPAVLRPTPQQSVKEATQTFTPLFDEKVLQTPRSLEEIVQGHRVTKKSLLARSRRREQQCGQQADMRALLGAELPTATADADRACAALAAYAAGDRASVERLVRASAAGVLRLEQTVDARRTDAETWLGYALRVQARLDSVLGVRRMDQMASPAGILMSAAPPPPVVALGHFQLPAQKDLSNLGVNPYRVDSWPIEPNSRYSRPSQIEQQFPAMAEEDAEIEAAAEAEAEWAADAAAAAAAAAEESSEEEEEEDAELEVDAAGLPDDLLAAAALLTPDDLAAPGDAAEPELVPKVPKRLPPLALHK